MLIAQSLAIFATMKGYFKDIFDTYKSLKIGMSLTLKHLVAARNPHKPLAINNKEYFQQSEGIVTLEYPYEAIPVPENGRYRLYNEMDDCIVCDKCAKICPVNCIDIEPIKATDDIGLTSDGTMKRLYAAKFDIDMAKCCFCGLCTTVCPTECLTMTSTYDFSEWDVRAMNYEFSNLSKEEAEEKRRLLEEKNRQKELSKNEISKPEDSQNASKVVAKPIFKPVIKKSTE